MTNLSLWRKWKGQFICLRHSYELLMMSGLSSPICSWWAVFWAIHFQIAPIMRRARGVKCSLTHSFSVEFGAIVSGTWNQPAYKNQTKLQTHVVFSTNKKYSPTAWRLWCYRNCSHSAPLFCTLGDSLRMQTSKPEETEWGSCNCAELLKTMGDLLACLFVFLFSISDRIPPPFPPG